MFRASTSTGILGARVCSLCRTYCDCNRWLRFSPNRVLRLHMHLSWGTSRQHIVFTPHHTGIGVLGASASDLCRTFCDCNRWFQYSPCRVHCPHFHVWWSTSRRHQQFMLHLRLSWCTSRWHKQCLTPRKHKYWSTSRLRLQPLPDLLRLQQEAQFSPCRAHRLHLHLWWSTSRRHQQFMMHLRLSWCTSRWHKQCLTLRKHRYWSTSRLRLQHMPDLLQLQQGVSFSPCRAHRLHVHLWWSTLRPHHNGMLHRACLNVHRATWDERAQFFDSVVIFPMSR